MPDQPTLQTVADLAGVSRTTVSNAYNRPDQLSEELRERILSIAAEVGYGGPDPAARSLRTGRAGAIGVLFTDSLEYALQDPTAAALLRGIVSSGEAAGLGLVLLPNSGDSAVQRAAVDGFIVYSVPDDFPGLTAALGRREPVVIIDAPDLGATTGYVGIDDRHGARMAAQHLIELGHRTIGVVADRLAADGYAGPAGSRRRDQVDYRVVRERFAGYAEAFQGAGIDWYDIPVYEAGANTPSAARSAASAMLSGSPRPTAILATSDQLAFGVLAEAASMGLSVPAGLSVVGFDDVPRAGAASPPLTTVRQPLIEKGRIALMLLLEQQQEQRVNLPVELVIRDSTGQPPTK